MPLVFPALAFSARTRAAGKAPNGIQFYATVNGDPQDNGTIIDFVQWKQGFGTQGSLGKVRQELRGWMGTDLTPTRRDNSRSEAMAAAAQLEAVVRDPESVRTAYRETRPIDEVNDYLTHVRKIPAKVYTHSKFLERVRLDPRGNIVFPHFEPTGQVVGFEMKNAGFTGFAKGGVKRLFASRPGHQDGKLVIAESGIDALSYGALHGVDQARFLSMSRTG